MALLALLALIAAWDRSSPPAVDAPAAPIAQEEPQAPNLSGEALRAAHEQCSRKAGEEFRRAWNEGSVATADWLETAEFSNHYNAKLGVCFYLLAVVRRTPADAGEAVLRRLMLFDVNEGELYGEYRGPESGGSAGAGMPAICRVAALYCASRNEWDRLVEPFMETKTGAS
jgi:hypothetical protein